MTRPVIFLRLSYWIAALADFAIAVVVLMPERMGTTETVYPMVLASATAFCWGVMLLLADKNPLDRRWILVPTALVVILLSVVRIIFNLKGVPESSVLLPLFGAALAVLIVYSLYIANKFESRTRT